MKVENITKGVCLRLRDDGNYLLNFSGMIGDYSKIIKTIKKYDIKVVTFSEEVDTKCFDLLQMIKSINIHSNEKFDPQNLFNLKELRSLKIEFTYISQFNFPKNLKIEELEIEWNKYLDIQRLILLKELTLRKLKLKQLPINLPLNLEHLQIIQGSLTSLKGVEKLKKLGSLTMCYLPKLEDFSQITELKNLEYLEFMNCKRLSKINFTEKLPKLKWIRIGNCLDIESLEPLSSLRHLKGISIWGNTNVLDNSLKMTENYIETKSLAPYESVNQQIFKSNK